jgi:hypothetical protein
MDIMTVAMDNAPGVCNSFEINYPNLDLISQANAANFLEELHADGLQYVWTAYGKLYNGVLLEDGQPFLNRNDNRAPALARPRRPKRILGPKK